ncbi:MAG: RsmB/NOP family class I SAM-dependent RNA methyltransferase [Pseudomonadota bacterium]
MTPGARAAAAIEILDTINSGVAAEKALTSWARASRFAGSGDRASIRDIVFDVLRRRRSSAALGGGETGRALVLGHLRGAGRAPEELFTGQGHAPPPLSDAERWAPPDILPDAIALDIPDWLWPDLATGLGDALAPVAQLLRQRAPVGLRVNVLKAGHAEAAAALEEDEIESTRHPLAETARVVQRNARRINGSRAYRDGLVELQDPASQAVVETLAPIATGSSVLDYCAGGGGKALALAALTRGPVFAHDADPARMADIPARAARAGAAIHRIGALDVAARPSWDLIFVDVPCSGSGAWRRQPASKWTLTPDRLEALCALQAKILARAARLLAPGGRLVYATCSLLGAENQAQILRFLATDQGATWRCRFERQFLPTEGGDGFFVAHLIRE